MKGDNNMKIDIIINKKAIEEIINLAHYRLFKLKYGGIYGGINYSSDFRLFEEEKLKKLLEMLYNLENERELIL